MAALCRGWGYACDVFVDKPASGAKRPATDPGPGKSSGRVGGHGGGGASGGAPPAKRPKPSPSPGLPPAAGVWPAGATPGSRPPPGWDACALPVFRAALEGPVAALWAEGLRHHSGPGCASLHPRDRAGLRAHDLRARLVDNSRSGAAAQLATELFGALAARHAAEAGGGGAGGAPAWAAESGPDAPLASSMRLLDTWLGLAAQGMHSLESLLRTQAGPGFTPAQVLYCDELRTAHAHLLAGMARAHAAAQPLGAASPADRAHATVLFECAARDLLRALALSLAQRREWVARFADELEGEPWLGVAEERTNVAAQQLLSAGASPPRTPGGAPGTSSPSLTPG